MNINAAMERYTKGEMDLIEKVALFQYLIDTGLVWTLPDRWQRDAKAMIELGLCHE